MSSHFFGQLIAHILTFCNLLIGNNGMTFPMGVLRELYMHLCDCLFVCVCMCAHLYTWLNTKVLSRKLIPSLNEI